LVSPFASDEDVPLQPLLGTTLQLKVLSSMMEKEEKYFKAKEFGLSFKSKEIPQKVCEYNDMFA
jgi:hypothetical protein